MKHLNNQYFNLPGLMTTVQNILDESAVDPVEFLPKLSLAWDGLMVLLMLPWIRGMVVIMINGGKPSALLIFLGIMELYFLFKLKHKVIGGILVKKALRLLEEVRVEYKKLTRDEKDQYVFMTDATLLVGGSVGIWIATVR